VNERRGVERVAGLFVRQLVRCHLAQFVVHQGQELLRGVRVAVFDGGQHVNCGQVDANRVNVNGVNSVQSFVSDRSARQSCAC